MNAIRPIYDGKDDLEYRSEVDAIDLMVCLFSETNERIKAMEDITEVERNKIEELVNLETLPQSNFMLRNRIDEVFPVPEFDEDGDFHRGTEFDELIVLFEITRWMEECGYEWSAVVPWKYKYTSMSLGIISAEDADDIVSEEANEYFICTEDRAFQELKLLLPHHWAKILLDWDPVIINNIGHEELVQFGNLTIVRSK